MSSLMNQQNKLEKAKRVQFLGTFFAGFLVSTFWTSWIGMPLMAWGAYLGWQWFKFRAKRGMRF
ncbi:hypothetical protein JYT19_00580 [Sulfobacillus acidophilus]|uniref:Uncharacterized protein n=1 Tax=Sulfobacillus acidophilus TaxID=53633 RepID=A0ABS3AX32_9FIRM|nr:hypothetical protein [Sulfobacillus acidophilus]